MPSWAAYTVVQALLLAQPKEPNMTPTHAFDDPDLPGINARRWGCLTTDGNAFEIPGAYLRDKPMHGLLSFLDGALYTVHALWVRDAEDAALARALGEVNGGIEAVRVMPDMPRALPVNDAPRW